MSADGTPPHILRELLNKGKTALKKKSNKPRKKPIVLDEEPYLNEIKEDLFIGNLHHLQTAGPRTQNIHIWTMFVSSNPNEIIPPKSVEKVIYHLHPTFHPPKVTVSEPPFYLQRRGWGYFEVRADIHLKVPQTHTHTDTSNESNTVTTTNDENAKPIPKTSKGKVLHVRHNIHFGLPMICHSTDDKELPYAINSTILQKLVIQQTKKHYLSGEALKRLNANRRRCFVLTQNNEKPPNPDSDSDNNDGKDDDNDDNGPDNEPINKKKMRAKLLMAMANHGGPRENVDEDDNTVVETVKTDSNGGKFIQHLTKMLKRGIVSKRWDDIPKKLIESKTTSMTLVVDILSNSLNMPTDIAKIVADYVTTHPVEFTEDEILTQIPQLTHVTIRDCHYQSIVISQPICVLIIEKCTNCNIYFNSVERCVTVYASSDCDLYCDGLVPPEPEDDEDDDDLIGIDVNDPNNAQIIEQRRRKRRALNDMRYFRTSDLNDTNYGTYTYRIENSKKINTHMVDPANKHRIVYLNVYSEVITHRIYDDGMCIKQWTNYNDEITHQQIAKQMKQIEAKKKEEREKIEKEKKEKEENNDNDNGNGNDNDNDWDDNNDNNDNNGAPMAPMAPMAPVRVINEEEEEESDRMFDVNGSRFWGNRHVVLVTWRHDEDKRKFGGCFVVGKGFSMMDGLNWL